MAQYPPPPSGYPVPPQGNYPPSQGYYAPPPMSGGYAVPPSYSPPPMSGGYAVPPSSYPPPQMSGGYTALPTPPEIAQQATTYQLGTLTQIYQANLIKLIGFAGIALLLTLVDIPFALSHPSNILVLLIFLALTVYAIWYLVAHFNLKAYIFTEGLIRAQGSQVDVMRWEHIEAVLEKIVRHRYRGLFTIYTSYNYTIRRSDGAQFKFSSALKSAKQLGEAMQQEVSRRQLPKAMAAYDSGSPVNFGPLSINMQGISKNGVLTPWNQIGQVRLSRGRVIVPKQGSLLAASNTSCSQVPNLLVFLQLVEHARRRNGGY